MIEFGDIVFDDSAPLGFILGPCVIESESKALQAAEMILKESPAPFVYKSSFDKANRSSINSYRGPGIKEGLSILKRVKEEFGIPVTTDIHLPEHAEQVAEVCDIIQIPAFLCRQTDLLIASAKTGLPVHVKKGQFMAPTDMKNVVEKLRESGCDQILVTDRGTSFGYRNLVSDMRSIPMMKDLGVPVGFDASHSIQLPGGLGNESGGEREYLPTLTKSAVVSGANVIYMETHPNPKEALCDSHSQWPIEYLSQLMNTLLALDSCNKEFANVYQS